MSEYKDILYDVKDHVATITFNRPDRMNAFRMGTYDEVIEAIQTAGWDPDIAAIVLTGAGDRAFCTGGDTGDAKSTRKGRGTIGVPVEMVHASIREVPKPVIAKVRGFAIGGGNVIATVCDLTIAAESAVFGQVGPKVGSVDPGFGTAYLARIVGEKRARELWFLCMRYSAQEAFAMGLVNKVVPDAELDAEVDRWCATSSIAARPRSRSPRRRSTPTASICAASRSSASRGSRSTTTPTRPRRPVRHFARSASRVSAPRHEDGSGEDA